METRLLRRNQIILSLKKFHTRAGWFMVLTHPGVQPPVAGGVIAAPCFACFCFFKNN